MQSEEQKREKYSAAQEPANVMTQGGDSEYVRLVAQITQFWESAKAKVAIAINTELLDSNWRSGRYIVELEQGSNPKTKYGDNLLVNLSKDFTGLRGK